MTFTVSVDGTKPLYIFIQETLGGCKAHIYILHVFLIWNFRLCFALPLNLPEVKPDSKQHKIVNTFLYNDLDVVESY